MPEIMLILFLALLASWRLLKKKSFHPSPRTAIFYDLLTEFLEDMALAKAIKEGENTEPVAREAIFKRLERLRGENI